MQMNEHDCVSIKLYMQKWVMGQIWPMGHSVSSPDVTHDHLSLTGWILPESELHSSKSFSALCLAKSSRTFGSLGPSQDQRTHPWISPISSFLPCHSLPRAIFFKTPNALWLSKVPLHAFTHIVPSARIALSTPLYQLVLQILRSSSAIWSSERSSLHYTLSLCTPGWARGPLLSTLIIFHDFCIVWKLFTCRYNSLIRLWILGGPQQCLTQ